MGEICHLCERHCNYSFCAYSSYLNFIKGTRKTLLHEVRLYRSNSVVMLLFHLMQRFGVCYIYYSAAIIESIFVCHYFLQSVVFIQLG